MGGRLGGWVCFCGWRESRRRDLIGFLDNSWYQRQVRSSHRLQQPKETEKQMFWTEGLVDDGGGYGKGRGRTGV